MANFAKIRIFSPASKPFVFLLRRNPFSRGKWGGREAAQRSWIALFP